MIGDRRGGRAPRAALIIAALILVGTGAWFAASYVDSPPDSTCGAAIYPSMWLGDPGAPDRCRGVMAIRVAISLASLAAAGACLYLAVRGRPITPSRAAAICTIAVATSLLMLVINEAVRSGGALEADG